MIQTGLKVLPRPKGPTRSVDSPQKQWLDDSLHHFGRSCKREISHMPKRKKTVSDHPISQSYSPKYRILSYSFCKANNNKINMEPKNWDLELKNDVRFQLGDFLDSILIFRVVISRLPTFYRKIIPHSPSCHPASNADLSVNLRWVQLAEFVSDPKLFQSAPLDKFKTNRPSRSCYHLEETLAKQLQMCLFCCCICNWVGVTADSLKVPEPCHGWPEKLSYAVTVVSNSCTI